MPFVPPRLYPITDVELSGLSHDEQVRRLAAGGASLVQMREKTASPAEFHRAAKLAAAVANKLGIRLIINDRVDIAAAVGADGVHLGQDDMPPEAARKILGPGRIIGFSTHNLKQAVEADRMPIDYIALGPVFATSSKEKPDPVVGVESLALVRPLISKPLVAIGGVTLDRAASVIAAGADSVAVISDLLKDGDLASSVKRFLEVLT